MKFKPGDEFLVKGAITDLHEGTDHPYFVAVNYDSVHWVSEDKIIPMDKTYEQGSADVWDMLRKLLAIAQDEREKILGYQSMGAIIEDLSAEYVMDKMEAYEKEIKVGDVVYYSKDGEISMQSIVTRIEGDVVYTVYSDGSCGREYYPNDLKKTGKHIDIGPLLRQIGE